MENQAGLEDRLRGLILSNSTDGNQELPPASVLPTSALWDKTDDSPNPFQKAQATQATQTTQPSHGTHKRPNQAQRRQMAAQLSIPIDTRPNPSSSTRNHVGHPRQQNLSFQSTNSPWNRPDSRNSNSAFLGGNRRENGRQGAGSQFQHRTQASQQPPGFQQQHRQAYSQGVAPHVVNAEDWASRPRPQQGHWPPDQRLHHLIEHGKAQAVVLDQLCADILANAEISIEELTEKENFRMKLEQICREVVIDHEFSVDGLLIAPHTVELKCFGSLASGFATKAADMDLALLSPQSVIQPDAPGSPIPRLLEKAFLDMGSGARLLTRTRVPIIKICERPADDLRAGLLAARLKWEAGESADVNVPEEEQPDEQATTAEAQDESATTTDTGIDVSSSAGGQEEPSNTPSTMTENPAKDGLSTKQRGQSSDGPQAALGNNDDPATIKMEFAKKLATLKQSGKSFDRYCGFVKTFIRKLGFFDMHQASAATFPPDIRWMVGDVCYAFINGLDDSDLTKRLLTYRSVSAMRGQCRTLQSVLIQAEGEMLAIRWTQRPLLEKDDRQEYYAQQALANWNRVQNQEDFHIDAVAYQKQLSHAFDRLKRVPSLQLLDFRQAEFESASDYYTRASKLMSELGGSERRDPSRKDVISVVLEHYIAGIRDADIRSGVEAFTATKRPRSLHLVGKRHISLQLARDYQKGLLNGYYQGHEAEAVRRYMGRLQLPMKRYRDEEADHTVIAMTKTMADNVLPVIIRLGNPALLPPNQPRDAYQDSLEFPKTGAGVQCDVNFSAHLALHNTALLRCYSYTDHRVKPLILFVKHWAKVRGINTPYRGSLSSYGYVLMVLHYLVNVVRPFVCPNLQLLAPPVDATTPPEHVTCKGYDVRFWRDENVIRQLAAQNQLNQNNQPLGELLRGFFEYYAFPGNMNSNPGVGFDWGREVLSLRTPGGILKKEAKGWTGAKVVKEVKTVAAPPATTAAGTAPADPNQKLVHGLPATQEVREVRHRYLFAIEDPFEHDHNVARTVTHTGIVAIRDEFRRAWRLIRNEAPNKVRDELLEDVTKAEKEKNRGSFEELIRELHGTHVFDDDEGDA